MGAFGPAEASTQVARSEPEASEDHRVDRLRSAGASQATEFVTAQTGFVTPGAAPRAESRARLARMTARSAAIRLRFGDRVADA
jgi:hypothetical protein